MHAWAAVCVLEVRWALLYHVGRAGLGGEGLAVTDSLQRASLAGPSPGLVFLNLSFWPLPPLAIFTNCRGNVNQTDMPTVYCRRCIVWTLYTLQGNQRWREAPCQDPKDPNTRTLAPKLMSQDLGNMCNNDQEHKGCYFI